MARLRPPAQPQSRSRALREARVVIGIEGSWPATWPEIVPQAGLSFVRYRGNAIVGAYVPSLPEIAVDLTPPDRS